MKLVVRLLPLLVGLDPELPDRQPSAGDHQLRIRSRLEASYQRFYVAL